MQVWTSNTAGERLLGVSLTGRLTGAPGPLLGSGHWHVQQPPPPTYTHIHTHPDTHKQRVCHDQLRTPHTHTLPRSPSPICVFSSPPAPPPAPAPPPSSAGIMDNVHTSGGACPEAGPLPELLRGLRAAAVAANASMAAALGVPASAAVTCVKPSGTVSQLVDAASGIHPRHSQASLTSGLLPRSPSPARSCLPASRGEGVKGGGCCSVVCPVAPPWAPPSHLHPLIRTAVVPGLGKAWGRGRAKVQMPAVATPPSLTAPHAPPPLPSAPPTPCKHTKCAYARTHAHTCTRPPPLSSTTSGACAATATTR